MPARPQTVDAMDSSRSDGIPYDTLTLGTNNRLVNTQTAYIPYGILNEEVQLASPEDMYLFNDNMYVADTGNKRIVVINSLDGSFVQEVKCDKFQSPKGVFVTENNRHYLFFLWPINSLKKYQYFLYSHKFLL